MKQLELNELIKILDTLIPDKPNNVFYQNGYRISVRKDNQTTSIEIEKVEPTVDVLEIINTYKEGINELDDCLFMDLIEELRAKGINLANLDRLIEMESYSKEDARVLVNLIDITSPIIKSLIANKISQLNKISDKF